MGPSPQGRSRSIPVGWLSAIPCRTGRLSFRPRGFEDPSGGLPRVQIRYTNPLVLSGYDFAPIARAHLIARIPTHHTLQARSFWARTLLVSISLQESSWASGRFASWIRCSGVARIRILSRPSSMDTYAPGRETRSLSWYSGGSTDPRCLWVPSFHLPRGRAAFSRGSATGTRVAFKCSPPPSLALPSEEEWLHGVERRTAREWSTLRGPPPATHYSQDAVFTLPVWRTAHGSSRQKRSPVRSCGVLPARHAGSQMAWGAND